MAPMDRHDRGAVDGGRRRRDLSRRRLAAALSLDLPDCVVQRGLGRCRCRTSRRTAGMGRRFSAPLMEEDVAHSDDEKELDRRHFLKCMAWVGTGAVWTMSSGVLKGSPLG